MKKKLQITGIVLGSILLLATIVVNIWWGYLKFTGATKTVSFTNEFGLQTITTTKGEEETQTLFEVSYWPNAFEVKINSVFDENADKFFYKAVQYSSSTGYFEAYQYYYDHEQSNKLFSKWNPFKHKVEINRDHYATISGYSREYQSDDNWTTSVGATNPLNNDTSLKIISNGKMYSLGMKGNQKIGEFYTFTEEGVHNYHNYYTEYFDYNWDYLFGLMLNACKGVSAGTSQYITMEFGDIFEVKEHTGNGSYVSIPNYYNFDGLITTEVLTRMTVKVNIYEDNLNSSSDSSIGWFNGSQTYNVEADKNGYFIGRDIINVTLDDFDLIINKENNTVRLDLADEFVDWYITYSGKIYLDILIDLDELTDRGYTFEGLSGNDLSKFSIKQFNLQYTENGETKVVAYDY